MQAEYPGAADYIQAAHFSERDSPIDTIVIHVTDGPHGNPRNTADFFAGGTREASAHFVVGQDGTVIQCVPLSKRAWHAHDMNSRSIGIEHCALTGEEALRHGWDEMPLTWEQLRASADLVRWLCDTYGITPTSQSIVGHKACDGKTNHDDCPEGIRDPDGDVGWPWEAYFQMVNDADLNKRPVVALLDLAFGLVGAATSLLTGG